jgi:hypothetical protein
MRRVQPAPGTFVCTASPPAVHPYRSTSTAPAVRSQPARSDNGSAEFNSSVRSEGRTLDASSTDVLRISIEARAEVIAELCAAVRPESALGDGP